MAEHNPGTPLFPSRLSGVREELPTPYLVTEGAVMHVGNGAYHMREPVMHIVPVQRATYRSHNIPFMKLSDNRER